MNSPMDLIAVGPIWVQYTIIGVYLTALMGFTGFAVAKAGRSPLWVLTLLVPIVPIIAIWVFAYAHWPRMSPETSGGKKEPGA